MTWVTWRQHRGEAIAVLGVSAFIATVLIITGLQMHTAFDAQGVAGCLSPVQPPSCSGVSTGYQQQFSGYLALYQWLNLVPLALGIFVGAPLVAREVGRTTHLLAWAQGVTRTRWIVTKVVILVGATLAVSAAFTLLMTWWLEPVVSIEGGALRPSNFDLQGIVPIGYFAAALAIGITAGTLLQRTLPAMGAAIVGFLGIRFGTISFLRPNLMSPDTVTTPFGSGISLSSRGAWVLSDHLSDAAGHTFDGRFALERLCPGLDSGKRALDACLHTRGVTETLVYQPVDRYWAFQGIELAGFLALTVALLLLTVWWVRRRIS